MKLLVSACLLGKPCRYDGKGFDPAAISCLTESTHTLIPVCPELLGGLDTPRSPCERAQGRVHNKLGEDVTDAFLMGAEKTLALTQEQGCHCALLKERSPSCGCNMVYDGSFCGRVISGEGVTAELLRQNGVVVFSETQLVDLMHWLSNQ